MSSLPDLLAQLPAASPFPFDLNSRSCLALDLSGDNVALAGLEPGDTAAIASWVERELARQGAVFAAGGYGEDRALYRRSALFQADPAQPRTVHLGIDLWLPAGTPVHAVLPGKVHSSADNSAFGDYGPTLILEHQAGGQTFHTLYGHLARTSLQHSPPGRVVAAGDTIGWLGSMQENGGWPPHLHFQVIGELGGRSGDFPGVCAAAEQAQWLQQCPDPNLLLRIAALGTR